jgi:hypothetical protein
MAFSRTSSNGTRDLVGNHMGRTILTSRCTALRLFYDAACWALHSAGQGLTGYSTQMTTASGYPVDRASPVELDSAGKSQRPEHGV